MTHHWQHISEADHMATVRELAEARGWHLQYHTHNSRRSDSGFPDLVLALVLVGDQHMGLCQVIFVELKTESGQPTPEQAEWLETMRRAGMEAYLWRPSDQDEIDWVLR
jgi:hypothetical protein